MTENPNYDMLRRGSPVSRLLVSMLVISVPGTLLLLIFILTGAALFRCDPAVLGNPSLVASQSETWFVRYALIIQDLCFFIVPAVIIIFMIRPKEDRQMFSVAGTGITDLVLLLVLMVFLVPLTGLSAELNSKLVLPHWLSGLEGWMREKEDYANDLIGVVLGEHSAAVLLVNILVVAVLPAIAEELLFRGALQRLFGDLFRSGHAAVWISSIVFSAVHLQFYGFLPRLILGLVLGYLFLWSGSIWIPVTAHFINNAMSVAVDFFQATGTSSQGPAETLPVTGAGWIVVSLLAVLPLLFYFRMRWARPHGDQHHSSQARFS
jgi:membrane protease YdiL (CAAX protease family)